MDTPLPTDGLPPGRAEQFELIRRHFLDGLPRRAQALDTAPDLASQLAVLHRLAGAAGSFGYGALGDVARDAHQALKTGDAAAAADRLAHLRQLVGQLAHA